MAMAPIFPRPGILPMRVTPRLFPRFMTYATRVRVHRHEYAPANVPAVDLMPKLVSNSVGPVGDFHEYYMLMSDGNPDAVMDIRLRAEVGDIQCEVARLGCAAMDIYLDDTMICSFPEISPEAVGPFIGYISFEIPIPE